MKIIMMTDLEGVAGYVSFDYNHDSRNNEVGRRLLTNEVNAAVDGLIEGGATEVLVIDGHGPGAINFPDLHEPATLLHGRPLPPRSVKAQIIRQYDVSVMIGQHAMAGVAQGNLAHTQSSRSIYSYTLNGRAIGEIAQWALYIGSFGVPLVFISGDEAACNEARDLIPDLVTASVKTGTGRNSAISLAHSAACSLIRKGAKNALAKHTRQPMQPLQWPAPYVLEKRFMHTDSVDALRDRTGVEVVDDLTVRMRSDNIQDIIYA